MKKKYIVPSIDIIEFVSQDVIMDVIELPDIGIEEGVDSEGWNWETGV